MGALRNGLFALLIGAMACVQDIPLTTDGPFDPSVVYASGTFATSDGQARGYRDGSQDIPVTLELTVVDPRYFEGGSADYLCTLSFTATEPVLADSQLMQARPELLFAWTVPDRAQRRGSCPMYETDTWGDLEQRLFDARWSLAIGPLDEEVRLAVRSDSAANGSSFSQDVQPYLVGAGFAWSALSDRVDQGYLANNRATAYVLHNGAVVRDSGDLVPLFAADVQQAPIVDAMWRVDLVFGVDVSLGLTSEPSR